MLLIPCYISEQWSPLVVDDISNRADKSICISHINIHGGLPDISQHEGLPTIIFEFSAVYIQYYSYFQFYWLHVVAAK